MHESATNGVETECKGQAMSRSYEAIQKQIGSLQRTAESLRDKEKSDAVARIKESIALYALNAADLGLKRTRGPNVAKPKVAAAKAGKGVAAKRATNGTGKSKVVKTAKSANGTANVRLPPKYKDKAGNTWGGRGPRPRWLNDAIAGGKSLESMLV
jgi:DNA-binding protein H-NS